jgi:ethanolamine utilization protein EutQ (cupin superfamily)
MIGLHLLILESASEGPEPLLTCCRCPLCVCTVPVRALRPGRRQIAMALNATVARLAPLTFEGSSEIQSQVVCGANGLIRTSLTNHCRIVSIWSNNRASSCSAVKVGDRHMATAGHCIYSKDLVSQQQGKGVSVCMAWGGMGWEG